MFEKKNKFQESSESSMSESWNIIDGNDVNNISEGSDGESIEVIEEEGNNNSDGKNTNKEEGDKDTVTTSLLHYEETTLNENDAYASSAAASETSGNWNTFNILGIATLILAVMLGGATSWVVFVQFEKIALGAYHYIVPEKMYTTGRGNNIQFYTEEEKLQRFVDFEHRMETRRLQRQINIYYEETNDLKTLVTDLSGAVESLTKELASLKSSEKTGHSPAAKKNNHIKNEENILYPEILDIHSGKHSNASIFQNEFNSSFEDVSKFVQQMILSLTDGQEQQSNMEVVKIFYQIPKYLSILSNFNSSNNNIVAFINAWRARLSFVNEKIVEDMRNMKLKMIKHFVKHMKCTQKKFYNRLCNLNGINKQECYDIVIKPYEHTGIFYFNDPDNFKEKYGLDDNITPKDISDNDSSAGKKSSYIKTAKQAESQEKTTKKVVQIIDEIHNEISNPKKQEELSDVEKIKKRINLKAFPKPLNNDVYEKSHNEKGMDNDLTTDPPNNDRTNSFSSFSKGQEEETSSQGETNFKSGKIRLRQKRKAELLQEKKEKLSGSLESDFNEGCWFLKIGNQRSKLRKSEARSNWLFDRAKYRNTRNT